MPLHFLTLADLYGGEEWEAAVTYPLPPEPHISLLLRARDKIIDHLEFVTFNLLRTNPIQGARELHLSAARLTEIAALEPRAENADVRDAIQIAASFATTTRPRSLRGFRRLEDHRLEAIEDVEVG